MDQEEGRGGLPGEGMWGTRPRHTDAGPLHGVLWGALEEVAQAGFPEWEATTKGFRGPSKEQVFTLSP